jgi:hypothetical protein
VVRSNCHVLVLVLSRELNAYKTVTPSHHSLCMLGARAVLEFPKNLCCGGDADCFQGESNEVRIPTKRQGGFEDRW